jgi:glutamate formiminotransferase / 5-formyltetrahydrofolate cyclo-ligase
LRPAAADCGDRRRPDRPGRRTGRLSRAGPLLAAPNVSDGRDRGRIEDLERAFSTGVDLLDRHSDPDHNRTVFTLAGDAAALAAALSRGAAAAVREIDMDAHGGVHPAIGSLDVCPLVWVDPADRGLAQGVATEVAVEIGKLGVPVFFYGELATGPEHVERAYFRNGGLSELWLRMEAGELRPDRGPGLPHRTAGATLVTARPPLGAFNVELDSGDLDLARAVAAGLRESGGGLPGVRAIGLPLSSGRVQVSTNVHDPTAVPLGAVVERVRALAAPLGSRPVEADLIGLIPAAALVGYPEDVPIRGFERESRTIEARLASLS